MLATLLLLPALFAPPTIHWNSDALALRQYSAAISRYTDVRREALERVHAGLPCRGPESLEEGRDALADHIRTARPHAREGDIFGPAIASVLRRQLREALDGLIAGAYEEGWEPDLPEAAVPPEVNAFVPWAHRRGDAAQLVKALPALPESLEDRLVGRDLVLLDVTARIAVDVLRDALP
jgi:hypothetical protein